MTALSSQVIFLHEYNGHRQKRQFSKRKSPTAGFNETKRYNHVPDPKRLRICVIYQKEM